MPLETSSKIRNISLVCALFVVSIHTYWPEDQPLSVCWFFHFLFREGVTRIAVPFFFTFSGYFLARHMEEPSWWPRETVKRVHSHLVPFAIWGAIGLAAGAIPSIIADIAAGRPFGTSVFPQYDSWLEILGLDVFRFPPGPIIQLWYLRTLFIFVLAGGIFKFCVKTFSHWFIGAMAFAFLAFGLPFASADAVSGLFLSWAFFFSLGVYLRYRPMKCPGAAACAAAGAAGLLLVALNIYLAYIGRFNLIIAKLSIPPMMLAVWRFMPAKEWPAWLTAYSFPIYISHRMFYNTGSLVMRNLGIEMPDFARCVALYLAMVLASILLAAGLRRFAPRFARLAFGGR